MKSFITFIAELNDGQTNAALTGHLAELFAAVKSHGLAGELSLKVKVVPAQAGNSGADKINVVCESQLKLPKPKQPADFFFLTDEAEPTRRHPKQHELQLREVAGAQPAPSEFRIAAATTFSTPDTDGVIQPLKEARQP